MVDLFDISQFSGDFFDEAEAILRKIENHIEKLYSKNGFYEEIDKIIHELSNLDSSAAFLGIESIRIECDKYISDLKQMKHLKKDETITPAILFMVDNIRNSVAKIFSNKKVKNIKEISTKNDNKSDKEIFASIERILFLKNKIAATDVEAAEQIDKEWSILSEYTKYQQTYGRIDEIIIVNIGDSEIAIRLSDIHELIRNIKIEDNISERGVLVDAGEFFNISRNESNSGNIAVVFEKEGKRVTVIFDNFVIRTKAVTAKFGKALTGTKGLWGTAVIHDEYILPIVDKETIML